MAGNGTLTFPLLLLLFLSAGPFCQASRPPSICMLNEAERELIVHVMTSDLPWSSRVVKKGLLAELGGEAV